MGKGSAPRPFTDRAVFEDNFDKIFGKKDKIKLTQHEVNSIETIEALIEIHDAKRKSRIDTIGQNGNDGLHYDKEWDKMKPAGQEILAEYELNSSTGEVQKRFIEGTSKPNESQFNGN